MEKSSPTTFYIVRHAHSESNEKGLVGGHWDVNLTEKGLIQAQNRAQSLKNVQFDAAFSSDLIRAQRTAEIIATDRQLAVQSTHLLKERAYGSLEGEKTEAELKHIRDLFKNYWNTEYNAKHKTRLTDGMESNEELMGRVITFLRELALAYQGKNVLIVSHGDVIITFLTHLGYIKGNEVLEFQNTGYIIVESDGIEFFVKQTEGLLLQKI